MIVTSRLAAIGIAFAAAIAPVTAHGEAPAAPDVEYRVTAADRTVTTALTHGRFALDEEAATFTVLAEDGKPVLVAPTRFLVDDKTLTARAALDDTGTRLTMTPDLLVPARASAAVPIASPAEDQAAMNEFSSRFGIATAVGTFLGTAAGLVVGGVVGCILTLPFFGVGCIPAAVPGAGIGSIVGTVAVGGPVLVLSAIELVNTLSAPDGTSKWMRSPERGSGK